MEHHCLAGGSPLLDLMQLARLAKTEHVITETYHLGGPAKAAAGQPWHGKLQPMHCMNTKHALHGQDLAVLLASYMVLCRAACIIDA